ncbi:hypothetical protein D3C84_730500 [compost metagenome]
MVILSDGKSDAPSNIENRLVTLKLLPRSGSPVENPAPLTMVASVVTLGNNREKAAAKWPPRLWPVTCREVVVLMTPRPSVNDAGTTSYTSEISPLTPGKLLR